MAGRASRRIRRCDAAKILDADAALLYRFAGTCTPEDAVAQAAVVCAYDALWGRRVDLPTPQKRRCFLLRHVADALDADCEAATVASLRETCGLTASQAGYVLNVPLSAIESVEPASAETAAEASDVPAELRRRALVRAGRLLLPLRRLAIVGAVLGLLAVGVLLLLAFAPRGRDDGETETRPTSRDLGGASPAAARLVASHNGLVAVDGPR